MFFTPSPTRKSRAAFLSILKIFPHDLAVLNTLRPILIELSDLSTCTSLFHAAFTHYQAAYPSGLGMDPTTKSEMPGGGFGLMEVLVLADLYNTQVRLFTQTLYAYSSTLQIQAEYEKAIEVIRHGIRWLQGRVEQRYWDVCEDDREFDLPEMPPRLGNAGEEGVQAGRYPLDVNARHRLAVARIKRGDVEEGKVCYSFSIPSVSLLNPMLPRYMQVWSFPKMSWIMHHCSLRSRMHISREKCTAMRSRYMRSLVQTQP